MCLSLQATRLQLELPASQAAGTDHSSQPRGFGFAVFRAWQGQAELPPAFLDGDFKPYEPQSTNVFFW